MMNERNGNSDLGELPESVRLFIDSVDGDRLPENEQETSSSNRPRMYAALLHLLKQPGKRFSGGEIADAIYGEEKSKYSAQAVAAIIRRLTRLSDEFYISRPKLYPRLHIISQGGAASEAGSGLRGYAVIIDRSSPDEVPFRGVDAKLLSGKDEVNIQSMDRVRLLWGATGKDLPGIAVEDVSFLLNQRCPYELPEGIKKYGDILWDNYLFRNSDAVVYDSKCYRIEYWWPIPDFGKGEKFRAVGCETSYHDVVATNLSLFEELPNNQSKKVWEAIADTLTDAMELSANALSIHIVLHIKKSNDAIIVVRGSKVAVDKRKFSASVTTRLRPDGDREFLKEPTDEDRDFCRIRIGESIDLRLIDIREAILSAARRKLGVKIAEALSESKIRIIGLAQGMVQGARVLLGYASLEDISKNEVMRSISLASNRWETDNVVFVSMDEKRLRKLLTKAGDNHAYVTDFLIMACDLYFQEMGRIEREKSTIMPVKIDNSI